MRVPAMFLTLLIVAAGCVTTGGSLMSAADTLDDQTQRFADELQRDRADEHMLRDAEALADAADDFHRAVERRESSDELNYRFERIAEHYHHLRQYYDGRYRGRDRDRYDDRYRSDERERFDAITTAYLEVENAFKYRGARHG